MEDDDENAPSLLDTGISNQKPMNMTPIAIAKAPQQQDFHGRMKLSQRNSQVGQIPESVVPFSGVKEPEIQAPD